MIQKVFLIAVACLFATSQAQMTTTLQAGNQIAALRTQITGCVGQLICSVTQLTFGCTVQCINPDQYCDGTTQCTNGVDEHGCEPMCVGMVICPDRKTCAFPCDGVTSCAGGEDEKDCATKCAKPQMLCSDYKTCALGCDGTPTCPDGGDELNCAPTCTAGKMLCGNGKACGTPCDKNDECPGAGDEVNCPFQCRCTKGDYICLASDKCLKRADVCEGAAGDDNARSCLVAKTGDDEDVTAFGTNCEP